MNTLWFAFIIYILGMAVVLYVRPSLMFDGGAWKEFGLTATNNNTTIFPFWMFVILWSIASYVAGTLCVLGFSSLSTQGVDAGPVAEAEETPVAEGQETPVAETAVAETAVAETPVAEAKEKATNELQFKDISKATLQMQKAMNRKRKLKLNRANRVSAVSAVSSEPSEPSEPSAKPVSGYYIKGKNKNGKSTYIYYGTEPPFE
jgi:hypothetical protein